MTQPPAALAPLPPQPADVSWPTQAWPRSEGPAKADRARLDRLLDHALGEAATPDLGETHAVLAVLGGRLVVERYGPGKHADQTFPSWSMAKSLTQALVGLAVGDGLLDIHAPASVPEWRGEGDPRAAITLDLLLRMSSGLDFIEDYVPDHPSDVIEMLWGAGKADVAAYAACRPLVHEPGSFWSYSSGTSNIVSRCLSDALGLRGPDFEAWMRRRLFEPLGMTSPVPKFDDAGTFIGSSFCFCTAQDFARFGLLYLRDGVWEGRRLLPEGWVEYARTPTWQQPNDDGPYGAHWWRETGGPGSFAAHGYGGQFIVVVPDLDLVLVRGGDTPLERRLNIKAWIGEVIDCFR
jgi:CubicO group peptidase (beta-lactamase class C family)